jgi:starch phosphorylase
VGDENIFLFGLTADEVIEKKRQGYNPLDYYNQNYELKRVIDRIAKGFDDGVSYASLSNRLLYGAGGAADEYMLLADFESYRYAQERAGLVYTDRKLWNQMALTNIARSGIFAADRSIRDYARDIWRVPTRE